jgi:hypothetical protein
MFPERHWKPNFEIARFLWTKARLAGVWRPKSWMSKLNGSQVVPMVGDRKFDAMERLRAIG